MRFGFLAVAALGSVLCGAAQASDTPGETHQQWTVACLSKMDSETSWAECRKGMFSPCAEHSVGGEAHLACLQGEKEAWRGHVDEQAEVLNRSLTANGTTELANLIGHWFGYVGNKCNDVARDKADISADAARLGCEISELAGLATEFNSCLNGTSKSPYCTLKD